MVMGGYRLPAAGCRASRLGAAGNHPVISQHAYLAHPDLDENRGGSGGCGDGRCSCFGHDASHGPLCRDHVGSHRHGRGFCRSMDRRPQCTVARSRPRRARHHRGLVAVARPGPRRRPGQVPPLVSGFADSARRVFLQALFPWGARHPFAVDRPGRRLVPRHPQAGAGSSKPSTAGTDQPGVSRGRRGAAGWPVGRLARWSSRASQPRPPLVQGG